MAKIFLFFLIWFSWCSLGFAQYSQVKGVFKSLESKKFDKAEKLLLKAAEKDSSLAAVHYAEASILFDSAYQNFNIDLAYQKALLSRSSFAMLDEKSMEKHVKIEIDLLSIDMLKKRIEYAGFYRATLENSETAYINFLDNFPNTIHERSAVAKRDSIAFSNARRVNTYHAYQNFMETYPNAMQIGEAKIRYEKLYFDKNTADGKLESYANFLRKHPTTPYRTEAETKIFEISTADNAASGFYQFLNRYSKSPLASKAKRLLFHLEDENYPALSDSLQMVTDLQNRGQLTVFYESGNYGFMDSTGSEVVRAAYGNLREDYLCRGLTTDFFRADEKVIALDGTIIFEGAFDDVYDLGMGVLKITTSSGNVVMHKSGWAISNQRYQDIKVVGDFIAYRYKDFWGLMTLTGLKLTKAEFQDIVSVGGFYLFKFNDQFDVLNKSVLAQSANKNPINFQALYADFELMDTNIIWLQSDYGETIFDEGLNEVVPYNQQEIVQLQSGYLVSSNKEVKLLDKDFGIQLKFKDENVIYNSFYLTFKDEINTSLVSLDSTVVLLKADSVQLLGNYFAIAYQYDSTVLFFRNDKRVFVENLEETKLLSSNSSAQYLSIRNNDKDEIIVYDVYGNVVLQGSYDEVTPVGEEYLVITKNGKKGLHSKRGKDSLLAAKYDAVASYNNGYISYFSDRKFGIIHDSLSINIKNDYDKNIQPYNEKFLIVQKDGRLGLVDKEGYNITDLDYEEILYWNDTSAIVRQNYEWLFLDINRRETILPALKSFQYVKNDSEIVIIGLVENRYGVFSNIRGEVIAPTFNDIINVGTTEFPIYFTEKHVEEAEFYVVIYYSATGALIRKQVYEAEDYTLIYCED